MDNILPGGEPFYLEGGGEKGCLLIHGFTGTPSHMRLLGEALVQEGITVLGVCLKGHGTHVSDLHRCRYTHWISSVYDGLCTLERTCQEIFVAGLSMGGTLALSLSISYPERIRGVISICAPVFFHDPILHLLPLIKYFKKTWKKKGRGIKDQRMVESAYPVLSLPALHELLKLCREVKQGLSSICCKALIVAALEDATVSLENAHYIKDHLGSKEKELLILENSYHVATLDYDAPILFERTASFIKGGH